MKPDKKAYESLDNEVKEYIESKSYDNISKYFLTRMYLIDPKLIDTFTTIRANNLEIASNRALEERFEGIVNIAYSKCEVQEKIDQLIRYCLTPTGKAFYSVRYLESVTAKEFLYSLLYDYGLRSKDVGMAYRSILSKLDGLRYSLNLDFVKEFFNVEEFIDISSRELKEAYKDFKAHLKEIREHDTETLLNDTYTWNRDAVAYYLDLWIKDNSSLSLHEYITKVLEVNFNEHILELVFIKDKELREKRLQYINKVNGTRYIRVQTFISKVAETILDSNYSISVCELVKEFKLYDFEIFSSKFNKFDEWSVLRKYANMNKSGMRIFNKSDIMKTKFTIKGYEIQNEDKEYVLDIIKSNNYPKAYGVFDYYLRKFVDEKIGNESEKAASPNTGKIKISDQDLINILLSMK